MNPENRRLWIRMVLGWPRKELSMAQKAVLIALETYADYRTGANAHPGIERLAVDCDLGVRAVRYALEKAQGHDADCPPDCNAHLGLIERTRVANSRVGMAAVYRLTMPGESASTTGTPMPPNGATTGTAMHHDRHAHDTTTGTTVPPTLQAPSKYPAVESDWGTSPGRPLADTHTDRPPSKFCDAHPRGTRNRCPDCGNARTAYEAWREDQAAQDVAIASAEDRERRTRRQLIEACHAAGGPCDDFGRLDDLSPCDHPNVPRIEHAS